MATKESQRDWRGLPVDAEAARARLKARGFIDLGNGVWGVCASDLRRAEADEARRFLAEAQTLSETVM